MDIKTSLLFGLSNNIRGEPVNKRIDYLLEMWEVAVNKDEGEKIDESTITENFLLVSAGVRDIALFYPESAEEIEMAVGLAKKFGTGFAIGNSPPGYRFFTFNDNYSDKIDELIEKNNMLVSSEKGVFEIIDVLGDKMGYPKCCTSAFAENIKKGIRPESRYIELMRKQNIAEREREKVCNDVPFREFVPCRPCCPEAIKLTEIIIGNSGSISSELKEIYLKSTEKDREKLIAAHQ